VIDVCVDWGQDWGDSSQGFIVDGEYDCMQLHYNGLDRNTEA